MSTKQCDELVLAVTGSANVMDLPTYIAGLRSDFCEGMSIVMSASASEMYPSKLLAALIGRAVVTDWWDHIEDGTAHIRLAHAASLFVVLPATGNTICK